MDFNTGGSGGRPDDQSRPLYGGEAGGSPSGPPRGPAGSPGGEFNLQDPIGSFIRTAREVLLNPVNFFRGIARQGDFISPAIFALICALVSAFLGGIIGLVLSPFFAGPGDTGEALLGGVVGFVASLILWPIITAIVLLIFAGILHLMTLVVIGSRNPGFETNYRIVLYASAIQLVSWIPVVNLLAYIYGVVLWVFGVREMHSTTTRQAVLVALVPGVIVLIFVLFLALGYIAALFVSTQPQQF